MNDPVTDCFTKFPNSFRTLLQILDSNEYKFLCWLLLQTYGYRDKAGHPRKHVEKRFQEIAEDLAISTHTAYRVAEVIVGVGFASRSGGQGKAPKFTLNLESVVSPAWDQLVQNLEKFRTGKLKTTCPNSEHVRIQNLEKHPYTERNSFLKKSSNKSLRSTKALGGARSHSALDPEFEAWAEKVYTRHPKKGAKAEAMRALRARFSINVPDRQIFESSHRQWCETHNWRKEHGRFCPQLHLWIATDDEWPYPPVQETKKCNQSTSMEDYYFPEALG